MIPSISDSLHSEEGLAFQQSRLAFFGKVGARFFVIAEMIHSVVRVGLPQAERWALHAGRPLYMAPEALGDPEHFLQTGCRVFVGHNMVEVVGRHHVHTVPTRPSARLGRPVPSSLEDLVLSCLEKDPDRRPLSARALLDALDNAPGVEPWTEADARAWWTARPERQEALRDPD